MLGRTFIHLPGVGSVTEREIWKSGISNWSEFLDSEFLPSRIERRRPGLQSLVQESQERLEKGHARYFHNNLPGGERWRLYGDFRDNAAFLDIETTGLSPQFGYITMVGILDSRGYKAFVHDENLEELREALEQYDLVVTFNGAAFDLPYVEHHFGNVFKDMAHIDLRFPLKKAGYSGGLKSIERQLGLARPSALSELDGFDAVLMWQMWLNGDRAARDTLVRYNAEDVASLPLLSETVYNKLAAELPTEVDALAPSHRHDIDLPFDPQTVERTKEYRNARWERS
ncbi:MAG: ribonuclease H-like domain-containing protein [Chloroflexi bacterium]|nr:ribonuclease H-like domain-containing protein [Chloroflexota bacterium]